MSKKKKVDFNVNENKSTSSKKKSHSSKKKHKKAKTNGMISDELIKPSKARRNSLLRNKNKNKKIKNRSKSNADPNSMKKQISIEIQNELNEAKSSELLIELELNNISNKERLKNVFKSFHNKLDEQQKKLFKKFDKEYDKLSKKLDDNGNNNNDNDNNDDIKLDIDDVNIKSKVGNNKLNVIDSANNTPAVDSKGNVLYIDDKGVLKYISKIGLIKGKKYEELEEEQDEAINKLRQILKYEEEVSIQRGRAQKLKKECEDEFAFVDQKKKEVEKELEKVKPLVDKAKKAVSSISKAAMDELRRLRKPPDVVKMVMECTVYLIKTELKKDWMETKKLISFQFVKEVLAYDTMQLIEQDGKKKVKLLTNKWLTHPDFTFERANMASKVAGPLVTWIQSQLQYADVLVKIKPLLDGIKEYEERLKVSQNEIKKAELMEIEAQSKIKKCRGEMLEMVGYRKIGNRYYK